MKELTQKIQEVFESCLSKEADLSRQLKIVADREQAVTIRENKATAFESAEAVLKEANRIRIAAENEWAAIREEKVKFDNWTKEERQAMANEHGRLAVLQDQEKQLFKDRQTLYDREQALAREQKDWKPRYIAKIKEHFKASGGKEPSPDDIT